MRNSIDLNQDWRFFPSGELDPAVRGHGNLGFFADETRAWQKVGNHAVAKADNPHTASWRRVDLPHDFVIEGEFTRQAPANNGSLKGGEAWYVRVFTLDESAAPQRVHVEFDGIYRNSMIFCNGQFIGRHLSGYTSFSFDLTEVCNFGGENALAVYVDARENELWSYEGGGIYRGVRLVLASPVAVTYCGVAIQTGGEETPGKVDARINIANRLYTESAATIRCTVISPEGTSVAAVEAEQTLPPQGCTEVSAVLVAPNVRLWSVDHPVLYSLRVEILIDGESVDRYEQAFGFRSIAFKPDTGFYLNDHALKIKGVCCHQDHAGVGVAVPPALQHWRVARLKEMGCNAIRTSHNPPDPALLDACDRLGMLVMDEIRLPGASGDLLEDFTSLVRRDRNHPSVILWSLGNEEMAIQDSPTGVRIISRLHALAKVLDPTRPTTYAMNCEWLDIVKRHAGNPQRTDVFGANYRSGNNSASYDLFHERYPDWPLIGAETWGGGASRGLYEPESNSIPLTMKRAKGFVQGDNPLTDGSFVSAYGEWATPWGYSIEEAWRDCVARTFMAGTFLWTGFDYRGEVGPYQWPAVITRFGLLDLCGYYKEVAHYLRAWWRSDEPHIFLMPHWNWEGREGHDILVRCYSNAMSVALSLNGVSLGRKDMPRNGSLEWSVAYAPGELKAIGYNAKGQEILQTVSQTASAPHSLTLSSRRIDVAGQAVSLYVIDVCVVDKRGVLCPRARNYISFELSGNGTIIGTGNGDPLSHEPDKGSSRYAYFGRCQLLIQAPRDYALSVTASAVFLRSASILFNA